MMKVKIVDLAKYVFIFFLVGWIFINALSYGTYISDCPEVYNLIINCNTIFWIALRISVLIKIVIQFKGRRSDFAAVILLIMAQLSIYISKGGWAAEIIWIICGMKDVNYKKIIKILFRTYLLGFFCIVIPTIFGLINDRVIYEDGFIRHSLGYNHPNALGARVLQLLFLWLLSKGKIKFRDSIILLIIDIALYKISRSRTSVILIAVTAVALFLIALSQKKGTLSSIASGILRKMKYTVPLIGVVAIYIAINYKKVLSYIGGTLWSRIYQASLYFNRYGITLFGNNLEINNNAESYGKMNTLYTLDNSYMYLLIGYGIVFFTLFIIVEGMLVYNAAKQKKYVLLLTMIIYIVYGLFETTLIRFTYNFSLLYIGTIVWGIKGNKEYEHTIYRTRRIY